MKTNLRFFYLAAIVLACSSSHLRAEEQQPQLIRISGGSNAGQGEFPGFVSLSKLGSSHICGGSILDELHIMTAAHCVIKEEATAISVLPQLNVEYPTRDDIAVNSTRVERMCIPSNYSHENNSTSYDVAILKLSEPLDLSQSSGLSAIQLPIREFENSMTAWAVGYGFIDSVGNTPDTLQKLKVKRNSCPAVEIHPTRICFCGVDGISDADFGDSGGPVLVKEEGREQTIYGIISYKDDFCPGVYADVYNLREEIDRLMIECA